VRPIPGHPDRRLVLTQVHDGGLKQSAQVLAHLAAAPAVAAVLLLSMVPVAEVAPASEVESAAVLAHEQDNPVALGLPVTAAVHSSSPGELSGVGAKRSAAARSAAKHAQHHEIYVLDSWLYSNVPAFLGLFHEHQQHCSHGGVQRCLRHKSAVHHEHEQENCHHRKLTLLMILMS